jgi:hypothetical protein
MADEVRVYSSVRKEMLSRVWSLLEKNLKGKLAKYISECLYFPNRNNAGL